MRIDFPGGLLPHTFVCFAGLPTRYVRKGTEWALNVVSPLLKRAPEQQIRTLASRCAWFMTSICFQGFEAHRNWSEKWTFTYHPLPCSISTCLLAGRTQNNCILLPEDTMSIQLDLSSEMFVEWHRVPLSTTSTVLEKLPVCHWSLLDNYENSLRRSFPRSECSSYFEELRAVASLLSLSPSSNWNEVKPSAIFVEPCRNSCSCSN